MTEERVQRKLTTILAADVEGYSRLMHADEEATLKTLGEYREIIDGLIARHDGRVFSTGGDSVLAEFGSAVEAVRCAISVQEEIASRNTELADNRKLMFRIGINVGDVMVRDDDLFGDGVNVAARLEGLAEAGGVCVSASVFEQVKHKLSLGFEDMGPQEVKNIAEPVSTFRLVPGQVSVAATKTPSAATRWRVPALAAVVVVIIAAGGLAWWQPWVERVAPADPAKMAYALPDKPSIISRYSPRVLSVASSSARMRRVYPSTSAARIVVSLRLTRSSVIATGPCQMLGRVGILCAGGA